ncbi:LAETG motif-containing sortase-dependent surface protein [Streptomyces ossamyceticus]|uniref:LAETG motif-containing sortase-dependent surface protein n=1 Tax=Streptomyces ossamyceticus TaxID=249581 RepID=A0ABV2V104_9ACTN
MSTSPRIARAARCLGVASASAALVFGVAGNAMARTIKDFSAVAECDGGQGVIRVTDVDPLGVPAEVTVYLENNGADLRKVGTQVIEGSTAEGVTVTFDEKWKPKAEYRIHIAADIVDDDLPILVAPDESCKKADDTPPASSEKQEKPGKPDKPGKPEEARKPEKPGQPAEKEPAEEGKAPTPSTSESGTPAGSGGTNNLPSPEGDSNLAETGADSDTGPIAGVAAVLVALGVGAVVYSMRRRGSSMR